MTTKKDSNMKFKKFAAPVIAASLLAVGLSACTIDDTDSEVVNENLDVAAEQFELNRRIIVVNGITDKYLMSIEGMCDMKPLKGRIMITCKVADGNGKDAYKRHQVYTSDNIGVIVEQLEPVKASAYHYRVIFKPQTIVPDIDFVGDTKELQQAVIPD